MTRPFLHLVAIVSFAISLPQLASAMGPISAPLKNQGVQTASSDPPAVTTPTPKTYHRSRHRH